jgi:hypothetical protein
MSTVTKPWNNVSGSGVCGVGFIPSNIVVENAKELINADNEWYFLKRQLENNQTNLGHKNIKEMYFFRVLIVIGQVMTKLQHRGISR